MSPGAQVVTTLVLLAVVGGLMIFFGLRSSRRIDGNQDQQNRPVRHRRRGHPMLLSILACSALLGVAIGVSLMDRGVVDAWHVGGEWGYRVGPVIVTWEIDSDGSRS